jgi:hypothetical protein
MGSESIIDKTVNKELEFYTSDANPRERSLSLSNTNPMNVMVGAKIDHFRSFNLHPSVRVGFSLLNLTGQSLRYLQQWEGGKQTVQYLNDGERGLLNFVPSQTLIRNSNIVEETFDVQQGKNERKKLVGNRLALQLCGHRWLKSIQADELGLQYKRLTPILGRVDPTRVHDDFKTKNALKLMIETVPFNGGRMMILRSVFSIRNECDHTIRILTTTELSDYSKESEAVNSVFELKTKESLYLPVSLLSKSILSSKGSSLGLIYLQPEDSSSVREELLNRLKIAPGLINYSTDPINLFQLAFRERKVFQGDLETEALSKLENDNFHISCHVNPEDRSRGRERRNNIRNSLESDQFWSAERDNAAVFRMPPFCYSIEVLYNTNIYGKKHTLTERDKESSFTTNLRIEDPRNFTIVVHPPLTIENLLPCSAYFEIVHAAEKRELWSSNIPSAKCQPIHTVSLEEPLLLLVNLSYCRAQEGILIHQPKCQFQEKGLFVNAFQKTIEGILEEADSEVITTIILYDSVGQAIRLNIENKQGGGGHRHIVIYCPYWIVNTSQFIYQIREEGEEVLTAGAVAWEK